MINNVDKSFYNVVTYAGNGDTRRIEFTDKGLSVACRIAFNGKFKAVSVQAIRMLLQCEGEVRFASHTKGYSSDAINELTMPWELANSGAELYPDEFQPWESDNMVFFEVDNPKKLSGNWISSTYHAEIAVKLIREQLIVLRERIRSSEKLCLAA